MTKKSKLLAVAPDKVEPRKPKGLVFGPPGVGKTWVSLDFPGVYYVDTERGAERDHYRDKLKASGGVYFGPDQGSLDFDTVIGQVEALATEKHPYNTLVLDSGSKLFNNSITEEQIRLGDKDAFGASKKQPVQKMGRLLRWINRIDMNVIIITHQKDLWGRDDNGNQTVIGQTFDCWDKLEYELDLVLRISKIGSGESAIRQANIGKSRLTGFPENTKFDWSYAEFASRYGKDVIEREVVPVALASEEHVAEIKRLLDTVKVPEGIQDKWFTKYSVDSFEEMDAATILSLIEFVKGKIAQ